MGTEFPREMAGRDEDYIANRNKHTASQNSISSVNIFVFKLFIPERRVSHSL